MRTFLFGLYGVVMVCLTACTDPLVVDNYQSSYEDEYQVQ